MDDEVSVEVRDFIARNVISLEQLEVLLLLRESEPRDWTVRDLNERLRSQERSIAKWLNGLVALQLAQKVNERFRFAPATEELRHQVNTLADVYRARRLKVIELIFSKPSETLQSFIDAFDLRRRK